jgi:hypothetical protein
VPKAGYYFAKRAFVPVLASFRPDGDRLELWISNRMQVRDRGHLEAGWLTSCPESVIRWR